METLVKSGLAADGVSAADLDGTARLRILSLCCLYPNPLQPRQGLFIQRRLQQIAQMTELRVVAPFAVMQYGDQTGHRIRIGESRCPVWRKDGGVTVWHPRWFYPPLSGSMTPLWLFARLLPTFARLRAESPIDVIDAHFGFPEGIAGALLGWALRVPFTVTLRGNEPKHSGTRSGRFWIGWALRRASVVFTVSERLRRFAINMGARPDDVVVVPNGVDAAIFHPRDRDVCRRKHGLSVDRRLIVSAGALVERKGHHRIVQALAEMAGGGPKPQLAIVGGPGPEGNFHDELTRVVASCGAQADVRFLGPLSPEALAEVMSAADVFCLASSNEGWPNVVHEALACGAPVVATDVGAIPEMLAGGARGFVVPFGDAAALRTALEDALRETWDRRAISEWAQSRGWRQVACEVLDCMRARVAAANSRVATLKGSV